MPRTDAELDEIYQIMRELTGAVLPTIEPVGVVEIAQRLGVKRNTVSMWRLRGIFPQPQGHISGVDWWDWETVATWQAGRKPHKRRSSP